MTTTRTHNKNHQTNLATPARTDKTKILQNTFWKGLLSEVEFTKENLQSYLSKENAFRNYEGISTTGYLQMETISNGRKHKGKFTKVRFEM